MTTHRFFLPDAVLVPGQPVDLTPLARQLARVLRLHAGAEIHLLDNRGSCFLTRIEMLDDRRGTGTVLAAHEMDSEPAALLTLYQCSLKADKFEWVLQKGTELGVAGFVPVVSVRSVVRPVAALAKKADRWQAIIREAAEQAGRARLPTLHPPVTFDAAVRHATELRLLPWEEADSHAPGLGELVGQSRPDALALLVGPEGGIAPEEAALAVAHGWQPVTLGPRILRAETAALAAVTIALDRLDELTRASRN
ncbi:MAG: 16S rRNA (uracil(1498)-N(3))-methyltransferase [Caldilineaceae bacterium]|nr:16S rRNA (uracil(1498)-N(3))-methyltransferase [Caldilineaceae bacterium]